MIRHKTVCKLAAKRASSMLLKGESPCEQQQLGRGRKTSPTSAGEASRVPVHSHFTTQTKDHTVFGNQNRTAGKQHLPIFGNLLFKFN